MQPHKPKSRAGMGRAALAAGTVLVSLPAVQAAADVTLPPISIGAGMQTNFYHCDTACVYSPGTFAEGSTTTDGFALDTIRLYVNGSVTDQIKMTFNTEYTGSGSNGNKVEVMDAIGRFEFSDMFNIWAGRFLPPSDRANLYGPYYANDWTPYADGVADYYPNVAVGRDNGIAYWGQFGIVKVQAGVFDGASLNTAAPDPTKLLTAARVTLDFWDPESGYYFNGTYYGDKDLLALGVAAQNQDSKTAYNIDGLMEKKLAGAGAVTVEVEYQKDNGLTATTSSDGYYGLASYLFPQVVGIGKFQVLGKYSEKKFDSASSPKVKTTEANFNYIIKTFSARVGLYYVQQKFDAIDTTAKEFGLKLQLQM